MENINTPTADLNEVRITGTAYDEISFKAGNCDSVFGSIASKKETGSMNFFKFVGFGEVARKVNDLQIKVGDRLLLTGSLEFKRYKASDGTMKGSYRIVVSKVEKLYEYGKRNVQHHANQAYQL